MSAFFSKYMEFVDLPNQEAPAIYHRWTLASIIGTLLGRQLYLPFGKSIIYPNQYIMLMGTPGTRKGSAMGIGRELLKAAGYSRFSASRTSLERFLIDFKHHDVPESLEELEDLVMDSPAESYIYVGEFVDFMGQSNLDFINLLTNLWDNLPEYKHPKIQGKSVEVHKPTVNLLGGSTPQTFSIAFPPEVIGTGFTSRVILVHAEPTGKRIAFPSSDDPLAAQFLVTHLQDIRKEVVGEAFFCADAKKFAQAIYNSEVHVDDTRFSFYQQRRYIHLLKLSLIIAASDLRKEIISTDLLAANTMLARAEKQMPKALGEFGRSKHSEAANEILQFLNRRTKPASIGDIFRAVSRTVKNQAELGDILNNLKLAEKVQFMNIQGKMGFMPLFTEAPEWRKEFIDLGWLTEEERF